jgi:effector-binding domain-containing protein
MQDCSLTDVTETPYLYVKRSATMDPDDISNKMGAAFHDVWGFMQSNGIEPAGPALSVYYTHAEGRMDFRAGFVVARDQMGKAAGAIKADVTPAGRVLHFTHKGPYATLRDHYSDLMAYADAQGLRIGAPAWELYLNDPGQVAPEDLLTEVYVSLE